MLNLNFTVVWFILSERISTFAGGSGFSSPVCPVFVIVVFPLYVTIDSVTHFLSAKSKYLTLIFSMS